MALDPELAELFATVPTPTISAVLNGMGIRAWLSGGPGIGVTPLDPDNAAFVATAFTMRAIPSRKGLQSMEAPVNAHHEACQAVGPGQALITDTGSSSSVSFFGELISTYLSKKGCEAIVTDAGICDVFDVAATGMPAFCARGSVASDGSMTICEHSCPISFCGVAVYPGDVLVGDRNGVVAVPRELAPEVAKKAHEKEELERYLVKKLAEGAELEGTYPPSEAQIAEYNAFKASL